MNFAGGYVKTQDINEDYKLQIFARFDWRDLNKKQKYKVG